MNPILQAYVPMVTFLGSVLGPDYEVVLHDLTDKNRSIIAIVNNHISGRQVGAPLTNIALKVLMDKSYEFSNFRLNDAGLTSDGKHLRSSTLFIKEESGKLIGMLCINFDDSRYRKFAEEVLTLCHPTDFLTNIVPLSVSSSENAPWTSVPPASEGLKGDASLLAENGAVYTPETEGFRNAKAEVTADAIAQAVKELKVPPERLNAQERITLIRSLEKNGVFLLKGAVQDVAEALRCSPATVYRYLSMVRDEG